MVTMMAVLPRPTLRRLAFVFIGSIGVIIMGALTAPKIIQRFQSASIQSEQTRGYFNQAVHAMANDHMFGVGLNAYAWVLANTDYYWYVYPKIYDDGAIDLDEFRYSERGESRLGTAHHIYYLMAAETGWYGMWAFILFLSRFYWRNIRLYFPTKDPFYKAIFLGLLVGSSTLHMQGLLEWIFRQTQVFYLFFILSGLMIAIERIRDQIPDLSSELITENHQPAIDAVCPPGKEPVQAVPYRKS